MPSPKRHRVHYVLTESALPESGLEPLTFYVAKAEQTVWFVQPDTTVVSLTELILNSKAVAPPRHGRDGEKGEKGDSIVGPRGEKGEKGDSIVGPSGRDGRDGLNGSNGRDCSAEIAALTTTVANLESRLSTAQAALTVLRTAVDEHQALLKGLEDRDKKCGEYLNFLRDRISKRLQS